MTTARVSLFAILLIVPASVAITACSAESGGTAGGDRGASKVSEGELCSVAPAFVGSFTWRRDGSSDFGEYETLFLDADGSYTAKVEAALVDPDIRCVVAPCTVPESGKWCADESAGELQLRPASGSVRTSSVTLERGVLELVRGDTTSVLVRDGIVPSACAAVLCLAGQICTVINGEATCVAP
ncbi:hypothetical protein LZC95_41325 [Pendulispora brunnea]|uniref:Ig-like domain-containing protein n=1 Tax=Pendulispora brunnea TaxID=2905690 RepID=A0ABZ2K2C6_9BACT